MFHLLNVVFSTDIFIFIAVGCSFCVSFIKLDTKLMSLTYIFPINYISAFSLIWGTLGNNFVDGSDLTAGRSRSHGGLLLRQILMFFLPGLGPSSQWSGANGPDAGATWPAPGIHTPRLTDLVMLSAPHAGSKIKLVSADILMCAQIQNQFKGNALGNYHSVDINIFMTLSRPDLLEIEVAERRSKIHHLEWAAGGMWTHSGFLSIHGEPPTCCCVCYVERAALLAVCPFNSFNRKKNTSGNQGIGKYSCESWLWR